MIASLPVLSSESLNNHIHTNIKYWLFRSWRVVDDFLEAKSLAVDDIIRVQD